MMTRASRLRFLLIHLLQLPAIALIIVSPHQAAWWCAALWSSCVTCAGTDSGWRWINRLLIVEAIIWLTLALVVTT